MRINENKKHEQETRTQTNQKNAKVLIEERNENDVTMATRVLLALIPYQH